MDSHLLYHYQYLEFRDVGIDEVINTYEDRDRDKGYISDVLITLLLVGRIFDVAFIINILEDISGDLFLEGAGISGSLFWFSVLKNSERLMKILYQRGCDIEYAGTCMYHNFIEASPLIVACQYQLVYIVKYLVTHGADLNTVNKKTGLTPLMILYDNCYTSYLITVYTDINLDMQDYNGNTLLHRVINECYDYDYFFFLLESGANPYIKNKNNEDCTVHFPLNLAADTTISIEKKLTYLEVFIHKICKPHYRKIIYDLFAACLNGSREVQKQIWNKALEVKSKISTYTREIIDTRLTSIIGYDRHVCRNNDELNNLQTEEDYLI